MASTGLVQPVVLTANFTRPADNTAYSAGDAIANSATLASVVPLTWKLPASTNGQIIGCRAVVTPASGSLVITALDFDLLVFRPATDIPFAAGSFPADNTAMAFTAAAYRDLIATFSFVNSAWRGTSGALTAEALGTQAVAAAFANSCFSVGGLGAANAMTTLIGVVQARAAWTPLGVANRFDFALNAILQ